MATYRVLIETKFVGRHVTRIEAKNDDTAIKEAKKLENEYNKVLRIVKMKGEIGNV